MEMRETFMSHSHSWHQYVCRSMVVPVAVAEEDIVFALFSYNLVCDFMIRSFVFSLEEEEKRGPRRVCPQ